MNSPQIKQPVIKLIVVFLFLVSCGIPKSDTSLSPVIPTAAGSPTREPTIILNPTAAFLMPGDKIGQMGLETSPSTIPGWMDYCTLSFSDQPGGGKIDCSMPLFHEFEIGAAWGAKNQALLDSSWNELSWELYVDNYAINLKSFGTFDTDVQAINGTMIKLRIWNLKLVNATEGKHTIRYIIHVNQEINDGLSITKPCTLESVVNLDLATPSVSLTTTPVQTSALTRVPWWNNTVFYEVFVRSFADSTTGPLANDGIGDLQGLIEKLDYLNDNNPNTSDDLGVTGLWLMPIMQSSSYHGYDITDYYTVNQDYGTNDDFKRLVAEAHKRGIKIIIDLVVNHTSSEHPWFVEARDDPTSEWRDWYIWSQSNPGYIGPWGEAVWYPSPTGYYYGIFWSGMPDLNLTNPQVTAEMDNIAQFWLQDMGVDGFRLDAARHLIEEGKIQADTEATHEWWKNFRTFYKAINPQALTVGEIWASDYEVDKYVQGDELDLAFDFNLAAAIINGVNTHNANRIQWSLRTSYSLFGRDQSATFLTNHDMNRVMNQLVMDIDKAKLAASILMTIPGVPFIYYGEEIGMLGTKPDELIRTPMQWSNDENAGFTAVTPWEPINADYKEKNVADESSDSSSLLSCYRELIRLHVNSPVLQHGEYNPVESKDSTVLAFLRSSKEGNVLMISNLSGKKVSDYALTLAKGSLIGTYQPVILYGEEAILPNLTANDQGGFDSYQPLIEISGYGTFIIQLLPIQ
jgi:alpha-amylase